MRFARLLFLSLIFLFNAIGADEQPVIVYGTDEAFLPYEWFSNEGNLEGFQVELNRAIGEASRIRQKLLRNL